MVSGVVQITVWHSKKTRKSAATMPCSPTEAEDTRRLIGISEHADRLSSTMCRSRDQPSSASSSRMQLILLGYCSYHCQLSLISSPLLSSLAL